MATSERIPGFSSEAARARFLAVYDRALERLWPVPVRAEDVPTSAGTVRIYRAGPDGEDPYVLLTGAGGNALAWHGWMERLGRSGPVVAVDPLGEPGRSVQTAPVYDGEAAAGWVEDLLGAIDARRAHLVGVSWGGYLALEHERRHPGRVAAVTLVDPVGFAPWSGRALRWLLVTGLAGMVLPRNLRRRAARRLRNRTIEDDELMRVARAAVRFRRPITRLQVLTDEQLAAVGVPVQVLLGAESVLHDSTAVATRLAAVVPTWRVQVVPGAGHALVMDAEDEVISRVRTFPGLGRAGSAAAQDPAHTPQPHTGSRA
jgi:pimeloyl-ACP methyl ester carboxylesterase